MKLVIWDILSDVKEAQLPKGGCLWATERKKRTFFKIHYLIRSILAAEWPELVQVWLLHADFSRIFWRNKFHGFWLFSWRAAIYVLVVLEGEKVNFWFYDCDTFFPPIINNSDCGQWKIVADTNSMKTYFWITLFWNDCWMGGLEFEEKLLYS